MHHLEPLDDGILTARFTWDGDDGVLETQLRDLDDERQTGPWADMQFAIG